MKMAVKSLIIAVLAIMFAFVLAGCDEAEDTSTSSNNSTPVVTPLDKVIDIAAVKGVVVPAYKLTPVTDITENAQYSGIVTWNDNPSTFDKDTEYTAIITLTPKTGYTLQGVGANFFKVVGAKSVGNAADSGVITAVFPKTDTKFVNKIEVKTQPANLIYTQGDALNLAGLVVTLTYNNGYTEPVNAESFPISSITTDPAQDDKLVYLTHNGKPIRIAYGKIAYSDLICTTYNLDINTPTAEDFNISGLTQYYDSNPKIVTITPKEGKSNGTITVKYNGSTDAPSAVGTYTVTFDVETVTNNFNAAGGLSAGTLTIEKATPTVTDFNISGNGTFTYDGSPKNVTITPKEGKSTGIITVYYEGIGSTIAPSTIGTYTVTFDVAATTNYNAENGFSAGTLTIEKATPTTADFNISGTGTFPYDGSPKTVTITPKEGKSNGTITVKYNGSTTAPSMIVGTYTVTFDVAEATNFNAASGLLAGPLTLSPPTFTNIAEMETYLQGNSKNTSATPYYINLNVSDLGGDSYTNNGSVGNILKNNDNKYVYLDFSGSTFASIGEGAFEECYGLTGVTIPDSVTSIGDWAFSFCSSLTSITIPNSVTSIGDWAFSYCSSLTSITIPNSVTSIGNNVFYNCSRLTAINVDSGNANYSSEQGILYNKSKTELIQYPVKKTDSSFTIPNGVTSIGNSAFRSCRSLTSVTISNSVTSIGGWAFEDCSSLTSITIPNSVTSIKGGAFSYCTGLTSIIIPNSVTSIAYAAFRNCTNLNSVTIGNGVTSIEGDNVNPSLSGVFSYCSSLTSITIPNSVTSIKGGAFSYCSSLTSITIPNSVTSIGNNVFSGCTRLTAINVDAGNSAYSSENGVLYNKNKTTLVLYLEGKTSDSFTIPNSVTSIGSYAFYDCRSLTSITIPNSVTSIAYAAFRCTNLNSVTFQGIISSNNFYPNGFLGDLCDKYLAEDGGIGTYKRSGNGTTSSPYTWTKQVGGDK